MLRSEELTLKLENVKNKIKTLQVENKIEEAHAKLIEIENLKKEVEVAKTLEKEEAKEAENKIENRGDNKMEKVNILRAIIKDMTNKRLTDAEKEAVKNSVDGESYILPQDISTKIRELIRDNKSFKDILGGIKTTATTGAFPVENFDTLTELVDFEDGTEIEEAQDIRFRQVKFALKQKGALIPLSNTLLAMTDNDLINYVARVFARKAVATYNKMALETLKQNKTVKTLADVKALSTALTTEIDPALLGGSVIVTNQDGYAHIASAVDGNSIAYLQPDLSKQKALCVDGVPVIVFSNATLKTVSKKAPVFYGNLAMGASFVDAGTYQFAYSAEAGFTKNVTMARVIDHVDCIQTDKADVVYQVGEITLP